MPDFPPSSRARAAVAAVAALVSIAVAPVAHARPTGPLVPPTGALLGAYTASTTVPATFTRTALAESLAYAETAAGRRLDIAHFYYGWKATFPTWRETEALAAGRIPMASWAGVDVKRVGAGLEDGVIAARADAVKALGKPVFVRWFWEMDGAARQPMAGTPAEFITAWRRIVKTFRSRGATNAVFVWCPNAWAFEIGKGAQWYPGGDVVDWVCADGYNWAPVKPKAKWQLFRRIFDPWYAWAATTGKPLMVGEVGAMEGTAGQKAAWIDDMRASIKAMPSIAAVVWFDTWDARGYDWRLRTSTSAAEAWGRLGRDAYFRTR